MPDTQATRLMVTKAYDRLIREKTNFAKNVAGATQADVNAARATLQRAIKEWEKPGPTDSFKPTKEAMKEKKFFIDKIKKALKK